jgi:hypothetical protein
MNENTWNRLSAYLPEWDQQTWDRLFGYRQAFDDRVVAVPISSVSFSAGKRWRPRLARHKAISGAIGAVVLTTLLVYWLSGMIFTEDELAKPLQRADKCP